MDIIERLYERRQIKLAKSILESAGYKVIKEDKENQLKFSGATLLSREEAESLLSSSERSNGRYRWWLRTPGDLENLVCVCIPDEGGVIKSDIDVSDNATIRPALKIRNLDSTDYKVGDMFTFGEKLFKIISKDLAFCTDVKGIGQCKYSEDNINNYEKSEVKRRVDNFFRGGVYEIARLKSHYPDTRWS